MKVTMITRKSKIKKDNSYRPNGVKKLSKTRDHKESKEKKVKKKKRTLTSVENESSKALVPVEKSKAKVKELTKEQNRLMRKILKKSKGLKSSFKTQIPRIHELLAAGNNSGAAALIQRGLLIALTEIVPKVENNVNKYPTTNNVYGLNSLVSQQLELLAAIRAEGDQSALVDRLCNEVLRTAFMDVANNLVTTMHHIFGVLKNDIKDDARNKMQATLETTSADMAKFVEGVFRETRDKIAKMILLEE